MSSGGERSLRSGLYSYNAPAAQAGRKERFYVSMPVLNCFPVSSLSPEQCSELDAAAKRARISALTMVAAAKSGHPGGAFSGTEMFLSVYGVADLTPANCNSLDRDYVVVSHGHTSAGVYAALAEWGFFDAYEAMAHFRQCGSVFHGHIERDVPGIDWGTGCLGQGLSAGVGFALAQRARGHKGRVYVMMGDGGQTKGQLSEARRMAVKESMTNLVALIDFNGIQISGSADDVMPCNIKGTWEADGWEVVECDGHSFVELYAALRAAGTNGKPTLIMCRTVMGRDGKDMEGTAAYHGKAPAHDLYEKIVKDLGGDFKILERALKTRKTKPVFNGRDIPPAQIKLDLGSSFVYDEDGKTDNRGAFGHALADVGRLSCGRPDCTPMLVFDCDLASSVMTAEFARDCPKNFVQCGIQEHSAAVSCGAASIAGTVPVWADFGAFGIDETYNQQRLNDINKAASKTVLTHVGLDVGEDGKTHQCIDYIGLARNMFGWKLIVPADPNQTDRATRWMLADGSCVMLAVGRSKVDIVLAGNRPVFAGDYSFEYGKAVKVRSGGDGAVFALGYMTQYALKAAETLAADGVNVSVWSVSCPLEVDTEALKEACGTGAILTVEDHNAETGMGSIMALAMARNGLSAKFSTLGVTRYGDSGTADDVRAAMGLNADGIVSAFRKLKN